MTTTTPYRRIIRGYTGQARFWANTVQNQPNSEEAVLLGWTRINERVTKPVFQLQDGRAVVMLDGPTHLDMTVVECLTPIVSEDALYEKKPDGHWYTEPMYPDAK